MTKIGYARLLLAAAALGVSTAASAEQLAGKQPWDFQQSNRASIAAMIVQKQSGALDGTSSSGGPANSCGGSAGQVTATANYTCIILNGSTADIQALQEALGNQSASSSTNATANGVPNSELSTVLQALVPVAAH